MSGSLIVIIKSNSDLENFKLEKFIYMKIRPIEYVKHIFEHSFTITDKLWSIYRKILIHKIGLF